MRLQAEFIDTDNRDLAEIVEYQEARIAALKARIVELEQEIDMVRAMGRRANRFPLNWQDWSNAGRLLEEVVSVKDGHCNSVLIEHAIPDNSEQFGDVIEVSVDNCCHSELSFDIKSESVLPIAICLAWCRMNGVELPE